MTASKHAFPKICVFCQEVFVARKSTTLYCSLNCASKAYKENKRQEKVLENKEQIKSKLIAPVIQIQAREVLNVNEVSLLLGVSRWTVQRMLKANKIQSFTIGARRLIFREELDNLFKSK